MVKILLILFMAVAVGCQTTEQVSSWTPVFDDQGIPDAYLQVVGYDSALLQYYVDWSTYEQTRAWADKVILNKQLKILKNRLGMDRI